MMQWIRIRVYTSLVRGNFLYVRPRITSPSIAGKTSRNQVK